MRHRGQISIFADVWGSTPATQRYRLHPCDIKILDFADICAKGLYCNPGRILLDGRFLHNHSTDSNSVSWRLLGPTLATRWYRICPCGIKALDLTDFCGWDLFIYPDGNLLNARLLHNRWTDFSSVC